MSVSYEEAIATLSAMFPELDADVLAALLRDNRGHMERTIDALLALQGGAPIADADSATAAADGDAARAAQEAQDRAVAQELQRRILVHDMVRERMLRQSASEGGPILFSSSAAAAAAAETEEEDSETWRELKAKWNQLSESAKLKMREWWSRVRPAPSAPTASGAQQRYAPLGAAAGAAAGATADEDDEQVAFDSSLLRRLKPADGGGGGAELDVLPASSAERLQPQPHQHPQQPSTAEHHETKKKKDD